MAKKIDEQPEYDYKINVMLAFQEITRKKILYDELYKYYKGNHPLRYNTERLRKAFDKIGTYFAENWIAVIVDAVLDRLILKGFDIQNETADDLIDNLWEKYHLHLMADDVHEAASVLGEAFVIAWKEDTDEGDKTDVYYNDPRMCHMFYDPYRPTEKLFAAKLWIGPDRYPRMMLYFSDRLEHYISKSKISIKTDWVGSGASFEPDIAYGENGIEPNEYGVIPVFHFRAGRISGKREIGKSELSLQDAVNKLFADMMVSSEFNTFVQRVIISQTDPGELKNNPGINWWIPSGDGKGQAASIEELGGRTLSPYLEAIDKLAQALAIISRTPKHYFLMQGGDPSGEALIAMEAPLTKKVKKRQEGYAVEWQALVAFLLQLEGTTIEVTEITPTWEPVETVQPLTNAQIIKTETDSGIPLVTAMRRRGAAKDELDQMEEDQKKQDERKSGLAQDALNKLREMDSQSNMNPDGTPKKPMMPNAPAQ